LLGNVTSFAAEALRETRRQLKPTVRRVTKEAGNMSKLNLSLPLLPESIAVGLPEDLLHYMVELKFLLLFFKKPLCVFVNSGFQYLDENTIDDIRNNKKVQTSVWGDLDEASSLKNIEVVLTEEWQEIMSYCVPHYYKINLVVDNQVEEHRGDYVFENSGISTQGILENFEQVYDEQGRTEDIELMLDDLLREYAIRMNTRMLIDILELCCEYRIPMIWGDPADTVAVSRYCKYLLDRYSQSNGDETVTAFLRTIKGDQLLRSIFELGIANIATVPINNLVAFREKNNDLLENFLVSYRGFLTELQSDPANYRKLTLSRTQKIVEELNTINNELLVLRKSEKFKWLENMSEGIFESAKSGSIIALWNLLASPILLAGELGKKLLSVANLGFKNLRDRKQQEQAMLFKSSSGYLWKIEQEFAKTA
jgi:hypothetical protein